MKKNKTNNKPAGEPEAKPVHIEFTHATATTVRIAGTFNDWRPEATPMIAVGEGRWAKELALPPGTYEYCVVVEGAWLCRSAGQGNRAQSVRRLELRPASGGPGLSEASGSGEEAVAERSDQP